MSNTIVPEGYEFMIDGFDERLDGVKQATNDTPMLDIMGSPDIDRYTSVSTDMSNEEVIQSELASVVEEIENATFTDNMYNYTALFAFMSILNVQGFSRKEICNKTRLTPAQYHEIVNSSVYLEIMRGMTFEVVNRARQQLATASLKATRRIVELLDSNDPKVRMAASKDILDRIGLKSAEEFVLRTEELRDDMTASNVDDSLDALKYGIDEIFRSRKRVGGNADGNNEPEE